MWYTHTWKYCSAIGMNELPTHSTMWMSLKIVILNERSQPPAKKKTKLFILDESIQKWKLSYGGRKQIIDHGLGWGYGQQEKGRKETRKLLREGSMFTIFSTRCFPECVCVKTYWILKFEFTQYIYVNYSLIKLLNIKKNKFDIKRMWRQ